MAEKFTLFWSGPFSQWHKSSFKTSSIFSEFTTEHTYNCCEQFMMAEKARCFYDKQALVDIMESDNPRDQKQLGRKVKGFNIDTWNAVSRDVVYQGNLCKFTQNDSLMEELKKTVGTTLVEASPYDKIWGIGLAEDDPRALDKNQWQGSNWLGEIITQLRINLIGE